MCCGARPKVSRARGLRLKPPLPSRCASRYCPRPLQHRRVHVVDLGHVAELQQAVGRQRLVRRGGAAEPLVALASGCLPGPGTRTRSASGSRGRAARGRLLQGRVGLVARLEVVEDQHVGVVRRRGLLEAAVRLIGVGRLREVLLGSVALYVATHGRSPVAVVPAAGSP